MYRAILLATGAAMLLSACGGGGGKPGNNVSPTPPVQTSTLSTITMANAPNVAGNAYAATMLLDTSPSPTGIRAVSPVLALIKRAGSAAQLINGAGRSQACTGGGTLAVNATLRSQQTINSGDSLTFTASNCVENGATMSGALTIAFSNMSGDIVNTYVFGATMDVRYTNFNIASGGEQAGIDGDMKIVISQTNAGTASVTISGKSLQATGQMPGAAVVNRTLADYTVTGSTLGTTGTSAASFTLTGSSATLGQFVYSVKNVQPFVSAGTATPLSGALVVNGASSSVTATVVGTGVRLDYSARGDGTVTESTTLAWAAFLSLL